MTKQKTFIAACAIGLGILIGGGAPTYAADVTIGYIGRQEPPREPLSFVEPILEDEGLQGAQLGIKDNATTGRLLGQNFTLDEVIVPEDGDPAAAARELLGRGVRLIVSDLPADALLAVADLPEASDALILNARARDDGLRRDKCRANVLHTMPSRAMLADALGQYLVFKRWTRWFLVEGPGEGDKKYADAIRRTAKRYNAKIVEDKPWTFETGNRRTDSGAVNERDAIQGFTQVSDYDILIVADEDDQFGEYLTDRTARPRPVAGTQGLTPTAWSRVTENWGATQLQRRFERQANRSMTERDHTRLACRPHHRRSRDPDQFRRSQDDRGLHPQPRFRARRLQGPAAQLPPLGWPDAPADPDHQSPHARLGLAAGRLPASGDRVGQPG